MFGLNLAGNLRSHGEICDVYESGLGRLAQV
jgi:hypothetical protein